MKKLIYNAVVLSVLLSTSCGKSEICDCADKGLAMVKEVKAAGMNVEKLQEIQNKLNLIWMSARNWMMEKQTRSKS